MSSSGGRANKHYCEICRIWIENHPNNIRLHQDGGRHRHNQKKYLKSENYREAQNKKKQEEIKEELLRMSNGVAKVRNDASRSIKNIRKHKHSQNVGLKNVFLPNNGACETFSHTFKHKNKAEDIGLNDEVENCSGFVDLNYHINESGKSQEANIGKWEEVKEGESVFNDVLHFDNNSSRNSFISASSHSNVNVKSNLSVFNSSLAGYEEHDGTNSIGKSGSGDHAKSEKIKIKFNTRKLPHNSQKEPANGKPK